MNHVMSYEALVPRFFSSIFPVSLREQLTAKQKTLLIIGSIAIGVFAAFKLIYNSCCKPKSFSASVPISSNISNSPRVSLLPPSSRIALPREDLEWSLQTMEIQIEQLQDIISAERERGEKAKKEAEQNKVLENYLGLMGHYLKAKFKNYSGENPDESKLESKSESREIRGQAAHAIGEHLARLSGFLDVNRHNQAFIHDALLEIDTFLTETFFVSNELCLREKQKMGLIILNKFFAIADTHLTTIKTQNPQLFFNLKKKLANLPLRDGVNPKTHAPLNRAQQFPNVYLTEKEQLAILVQHFQSEEDANLTRVIQEISFRRFMSSRFTTSFTTSEIRKLAKMASNDRSRLSPANRSRLQTALVARMGFMEVIRLAFSINWSHFDTLVARLNKVFNPMQSSEAVGYAGRYESPNFEKISYLHRASKAKKFFERQMDLGEEEISIPRWYHATKDDIVPLIITSNEVRVEARTFKGAWVSTQIELGYGTSVFAFKHRIAQIDPNVSIQVEHERSNWRGLQQNIPLLDERHICNVSLIGFNKRTDKQKIMADLASKRMTGVSVVSIAQVTYIQKGVIKALGKPNLSEGWWGKGDASTLDHQL